MSLFTTYAVRARAQKATSGYFSIARSFLDEQIRKQQGFPQHEIFLSRACDDKEPVLGIAGIGIASALAEQPTPILPDPKLTPGDTFDVTAQDLSVPDYAKKVRNVAEEVKREVYREYCAMKSRPW
jgi:hypothetical protein